MIRSVKHVKSIHLWLFRSWETQPMFMEKHVIPRSTEVSSCFLNVFFLVRLSCLFPSMFNNFRCLSMGFTDKPDKWVCLKIGYRDPYTPFHWANYNNSQTWIKAIWGWFPLLTMIPRARSQWGRYNLPRFHPLVNHPFPHKKLLSCFRVQAPSFNTRVYLIWDRGVVIFVHLINVGITIYERTHIHNI